MRFLHIDWESFQCGPAIVFYPNLMLHKRPLLVSILVSIFTLIEVNRLYVNYNSKVYRMVFVELVEEEE